MSHPDHFALFALPARFALDETALEQSYRNVQSTVHPDRYAASSAAERRVAMQWAARANEAYRTLKSPQARAAYLCERAGVSIDAGTNTSMPADFLMQQMDWREALDDVRAQADAGRLAALTDSIGAERVRLLVAIEDAIDVRSDFAAAAGMVRRLMFVDRFADELRAAAQELPHKASA
jgi:molecular chaperone HscB